CGRRRRRVASRRGRSAARRRPMRRSESWGHLPTWAEARSLSKALGVASNRFRFAKCRSSQHNPEWRHAGVSAMLKTGNLTALFHELVRGALSSQRVASSEATEFYLVQLLEGFARPTRGDLLDPPLAVDYLEAFHLPGQQRVGKLRRV